MNCLICYTMKFKSSKFGIGLNCFANIPAGHWPLVKKWNVLTNSSALSGLIFKYTSRSCISVSEKQTTQWNNQQDLNRHFCKENITIIVQNLNHVWLCEPIKCSTPVCREGNLTCPSLSLTVCPNSCPLSLLYRPAISSLITPFYSCPQSFPESGSFPMSWLFPSYGQSIRASASS